MHQYELPLSEALDPATGLPLIPSAAVRKQEQAVLDQAFAILAKRHTPGELLAHPEATKDYLRLRLAGARNEVFAVSFSTTGTASSRLKTCSSAPSTAPLSIHV